MMRKLFRVLGVSFGCLGFLVALFAVVSAVGGDHFAYNVVMNQRASFYGDVAVAAMFGSWIVSLVFLWAGGVTLE